MNIAPDETASALFEVARRSGSWRDAAFAIGVVLDKQCQDNATKICAIADILAAVTRLEPPGIRDALRDCLPALIRHAEREARN